MLPVQIINSGFYTLLKTNYNGQFFIKQELIVIGPPSKEISLYPKITLAQICLIYQVYQVGEG